MTNGTTRDLGIELIAASRFYEYLKAIGDTDADNVLFQGQISYDYFVDAQGCQNGFPTGCTPPPLANTDSSFHGDPRALNFERGVHQSSRNSIGWCGTSGGGVESGLTGNYRVGLSFQQSILIEGVLAYRRAKGTSWSGYNRALDLAFGMGQWALTENYQDDGTSRWQILSAQPYTVFPMNGYRYMIPTDMKAQCPAMTTVDANVLVVGSAIMDPDAMGNAVQGGWFPFYVNYLTTGSTAWERKAKIEMDMVGNFQSWPSDFGGYLINNLIYSVTSPSGLSLQDVSFTFADLGSGNYRLTYTVPSGTCASVGCLRIKWGPKILQTDLSRILDFDSMSTQTFGVDPATYQPWFSANNTTEPTPTPGISQSFDINTGGVTGLSAANFSVKAMAGGGTGIGRPIDGGKILTGGRITK
jgi:hypothetical protein